jgi:ribonuclease D
MDNNVVKLGGEKFARIREQARGSVFPEDFLWFWSEYPNKKAKLDALKAWRQTAGDRPATEELIAAINKQRHSDQWSRGFIPHPATWLRAGRWMDDEE